MNNKSSKNNIKNDNNSNSKYSKTKRLRTLMIVIFVLFFLLLFRIGYLQFVKGSYLKEMATKQQSTSRIINAKRGTIYDSTGTALAISADVDTITVNPDKLKKKTDEETTVLREKVAKELSTLFELDYEETLGKVSSSNKVETIVSKIEKDKVTELENWMKENKISSGINIDEDTKRYYPYSDLASNLIGFCGSDNQGLTGLEYYWDSTLAGTAGKITTTQDASQDLISNEDAQYYAAQNGSNLTLTVDINIQTIAEKYLEQACVSNKCADGGNIIIMDPNTGDILAMATYPDYNLNTPFEPNETLSSTWDSLSKTAQSEALQKMWRNTAVSNTYEPGSVFKVVVASAALEENIVETDTPAIFYCSGVQEVADRKIHCANAAGHGYQSLRQALQNSCNPGFVELGRRLGKETLFDYINKFGYGKKTGIDLNGESSGILFNLDKVGPVELATTAFGQGVSVTAIQQVAAVSAAINGGTLYKPYIVKRITEHETGQIIKEIEPTKVRENIVTKETSEKVRMTLESVVSLGTGRNAYIDGYRVGGKIGTAQKVNNGVYMHGNYIVSFIGFMPANDPKVVVYLAIDNPKGVTQYGGTVSAPIVKNILEDAISALNIKKQEGGTDKKYQWYDQKYYTVEDVVGLTKKEAASKLKSFTIEYSGSGDKVINQSPEAGSRIPEYSSIRLYLD